MYHLELRKFPHTACRFNQNEAQLRAIVVPWTRQEWIEEGERKWNANEAQLTILQGPELSMPDLAMGKGWRNAQKRSRDVTQAVLGSLGPGAQRGQQAGAPGAPAGAEAPGALAVQGGGELLADSLGLELLALLDDSVLTPVQVWQIAREQLRGQDPSGGTSAAESLALAERALGSLLRRGLVVLRRRGREGESVAAGEPETVLGAIETWAGDGQGPPGGPEQLVIARKA